MTATAAYLLIGYTPQTDIRNLEALPRGTGARYLEVLLSHEPGVLIAHSWRRKAPASMPAGHALVLFS